MNIIYYFSPELAVIITLLLLLIVEILFPKKSLIALLISLIGIFIASFFTFEQLLNMNREFFTGLSNLAQNQDYVRYILTSIRFGPIERIFDFIFLIGTLLFVLLSYSYYKNRAGGDYYFLIFCALLGSMLIQKSENWATFILSLEILSFSLYALVGFRRDLFSYEAATKYFFIGAFSTSFLIFGIGFLYLVSYSLSFESLFQYFAFKSLFGLLKEKEFLAILGIGFIIVGLGFKISAVPFHFWTPDVFEGSPSPTAGYIATVSKVALFALILKLFQGVLSAYPKLWEDLILWISVFTMIVGNLTALRERSIKKLLAFSTIANAGYALTAIYSGGLEGFKSIILFLFIYTIMTFGAFAIVQMVSENNTDIENLRGLYKKSPFLAISLSIIMLSLAGVPPFAGFFAKFYIAYSILIANNIALAVWLFLNGIISYFYYLRVVYYAFSDGKKEDIEFKFLPLFIASICVVLVIFFGIYPDSILGFIDNVFNKFIGG
ncbi:MAG: NADH-quinone oxidoreductase subunit N [candidate division WOR-3 bacterium]